MKTEKTDKPPSSPSAFEDYIKIIADSAIKDVEKTIGRSMTKTQKQGLYGAGSLMFLEAMIDKFYLHRQDMVKIEAWLKEIDGFKRC